MSIITIEPVTGSSFHQPKVKSITLDEVAITVTRDYINKMVLKVETLTNANAILASQNTDCIRAIENNKQTIQALDTELTQLRARLTTLCDLWASLPAGYKEGLREYHLSIYRQWCELLDTPAQEAGAG